jgi:hypothetical protein
MLRGLRAATDARSADWIVHGVRDDYTVGSLVPTVFEHYARVFHPASRDHRIGDESIEVRWADVASANNRTMHPVAEWGSLTGSWQLQEQPELWNQEPRTGKLPKRLAKNLAEVLAGHTRTSDRCYFGVWEGWGVPTLMFLFKEGTPERSRQRTEEEAQKALEAEVVAWRGLLDVAPTFDIPHRTMHLLEGPLDAVSEFYESHRDVPSLWWPADRAWGVATGIDLMTTYVGGSSEAIQVLLDDEQIEALAVSDDQSITWEADTINPLPPPPG